MVRQKSPEPGAKLNDLAIKYICAWEANWPLRHNFTQNELRSVRSTLLDFVMQRYIKTGQMRLTQDEIKKAVNLAKRLDRPVIQQNGNKADTICCDYVKIFIENWRARQQYTTKELLLISTILYGFVIERYESSKLTRLSVSKKELRYAMERINVQRARLAREAQADARDQMVRSQRSRYGSAVENRFVLHS